jgi:SAM-dependent methyltransferase
MDRRVLTDWELLLKSGGRLVSEPGGNASRVSQSGFWEQAYQEGRAGWDLGHAALAFEDLLASPEAPKSGRVAVIGCGRGHDAILFARSGLDVVGFDFAPSAVDAARQSARASNVVADFVQADIFALPTRYRETFDYVVEHACFSAIDPARRPEYVEVVGSLLRQGGELIGLFFAHGQPGGPPFSTDANELRSLFENSFLEEELAAPDRSVERRRGHELFVRFRRR